MPAHSSRPVGPDIRAVFDDEGDLVGLQPASDRQIAFLAGDRLSGEQTRALLASFPLRAGVSSVMLVGDSNSAFGWDQGPSVTAITANGDGTATVTFSGSHNWTTGQTITVNNSPTRALNVFSASVTAIVNSGTFSVTYTLTGRTSPVTSAAAASTQTLHMLRYSPIGYPAWLEALQSRRLGYVLAAAGGSDAEQALLMYDDAIEEAAEARVSDIVVMIGTVDVFSRALSFADAQASIKALMDRIVATSAARVWWLTPPPLNSAASSWSEAKQTVMNRLVRWMWRYANQIGAFPIDSWRGAQNGAAFVDATASNPDATTSFLQSDNTHTTCLGALAIARSLDTAWRQVQATPALAYQGAHADTQNQGNALTNSRLTGTGGTKTAGSGTISGDSPDSWTTEITSGSGTITLTNPARTVATDGDADGFNLQVIPSVAALTWRILQSGIHSALTVGEVREAYWPITITSAAGLTGIELILFGTKSSGGNENIGFAGTSVAITGAFSGVIRIPRWTVPSGLTALSMFIRFTQTGTPAGTFILGKPCLELVE